MLAVSLPRIVGFSAAVPEHRVQTDQLPFLTSKQKDQFKQQVGVIEKRFSYDRITAGDLCLSAAEKLLRELRWDPSSVGIVILVTQSPDQLMPATAIALQEKLRLPTSALAFDINLGCSGWVYGLSVVSSMMQTLGIGRGLLLAGETSVLTSEDDLGYFALMGDAGTATALELSENAVPMHFQFYSDGSRAQAIHAPNSGARHFANGGKETGLQYKAKMNADEVLRFCIQDVVPDIRSFMADHAVSPENVDRFIFHQANRLINESMRKKLNVPVERFPYSIGQFGNTSSASIPLTIVSQLGEQMTAKQTLLCSGFGVGLSMAHVLLTTESVKFVPLIEVKVPEP